jgi:hypothetical protein
VKKCKSSSYSNNKRNKYEIRNELLLETMDTLGVCTPIEAARVWGTGVKNRNAALQYSVMTDELKEKYKAEIEKNAPNWVTGFSSPWIDSYSILNIKIPSLNIYIIEILFYFSTSIGHYGSSKAFLNLSREDFFYKINKISMEDFLYPYTGFTLTK